MDSATDRQETATRQKALAGQAKTATQGMETESKELEASTAESAKQAQNSEVAAAGSMYKASDMSRTAVGDLEKSQVGADETSEDMYAAQGSANIAGERSEKSKESFAASEGASTLATMTAARAHRQQRDQQGAKPCSGSGCGHDHELQELRDGGGQAQGHRGLADRGRGRRGRGVVRGRLRGEAGGGGAEGHDIGGRPVEERLNHAARGRRA